MKRKGFIESVAELILAIMEFKSRNQSKKIEIKNEVSEDSIESKPQKKSVAKTFELTIIENPALDINYFKDIPEDKVASDSNEGDYYNVSLANVTCDCRDFIDRRASLEPSDPRRICKHLLEVIRKHGLLKTQSELIQVLLSRHIGKTKLTTIQMSNGNTVIITHGDGDWVDVYTRKKKSGDKNGVYTGEYARYGFRHTDNSWARSESPVGARELKSVVSQIVGL